MQKRIRGEVPGQLTCRPQSQRGAFLQGRAVPLGELGHTELLALSLRNGSDERSAGVLLPAVPWASLPRVCAGHAAMGPGSAPSGLLVPLQPALRTRQT